MSTELEFTRNELTKGVQLVGGAPVRLRVLDCSLVFVLDVEDTHFNHDRFLVMPESSLSGDDAAKIEPGLTGLDVIAAAIQHGLEHPKRELLVTGHTDSVGAPDYNLQISLHRANCVYFTLKGHDFKKEWVDLALKGNHADDWRRILRWADKAFGYDCEASDPDAPDYAVDVKAIRNFQNRYNSDVEALRAGNRHAPGFSKPISDAQKGFVGIETWQAFFDCYQRHLEFLLAFPNYEELRKAQLAIPDVSPGPTQGCGENHPRNVETRKKHRQEGYPDRNEEEPEDRRVELLFFDPGEAPEFPCHPSVEATSCDPALCQLYDDSFFLHRRLPKAGTAKQAILRLVSVEAGPTGRDFSPQLGEKVTFEVEFDSLNTPFEGTLELTVGRSTRSGTNDVAKLTLEVCENASESGKFTLTWNGTATTNAPMAFSERTTRDHAASREANIPLIDVRSGEPVPKGLYHATRILLTEKDGTIAGAATPTRTEFSVPTLCNLTFPNRAFMDDLFRFGLGQSDATGDTVSFFEPQAHAGILIRARSYYEKPTDGGNPINLRFVLNESVPRSKCLLCVVGGSGTTGGATGKAPDPLTENIYALHDRGLKITVSPAAALSNNKLPPDSPQRVRFREIFGPMGVQESADEFENGEPAPRRVEDGVVTGRLERIDVDNVEVTVSATGEPKVESLNPTIVPELRRKQIETALRAVIVSTAQTTAHEYAHACGLVSRLRDPDDVPDLPPNEDFNTIEVEGEKVRSPLLGDEGAHNRNPTNLNMMDSGADTPPDVKLEESGRIKFLPQNLTYLRDVAPFAPGS